MFSRYHVAWVPRIPGHQKVIGTTVCTVYSVQCTVYSVQCTVYSVQCTVYSVQCTVYSVQCTVYSEKRGKTGKKNGKKKWKSQNPYTYTTPSGRHVTEAKIILYFLFFTPSVAVHPIAYIIRGSVEVSASITHSFYIIYLPAVLQNGISAYTAVSRAKKGGGVGEEGGTVNLFNGSQCRCSSVLDRSELFLIGFFKSDVNHKMDVRLHGWVSTPSTPGHTKVHCSREGCCISTIFSRSKPTLYSHHRRNASPPQGSPMGSTRIRLALLGVALLTLYFAMGESEAAIDDNIRSDKKDKPAKCAFECINGGKLGEDCKCTCTAGFSGVNCAEVVIENKNPLLKKRDKKEREDPEAKDLREAEEDERKAAAKKEDVPKERPDNYDTLSEAEKVLVDHPYLQYADEGRIACEKRNEVWHDRIRKAYPTNDVVHGREGLHLFFTTDCTRHSLWQAVTLENTWASVRQPGALTRIVSGCYNSKGVPSKNTELMTRSVIDNEKFFIFFGPRVGSEARRKDVTCSATKSGWFEGRIHSDSKQANVDACKQHCASEKGCNAFNFRHGDGACHLFESTSNYHDADDHSTGTCTGSKGATLPSYLADYSPINRPATAMYWLNYAKPLERVLGLLDPDMIFNKPLLWHFEGAQIVEKGRPVGQFYDYLVTQDWDKHYDKVCLDKERCKPLGNKKDFAPGPPHLMHRDDWQDVAPWWLRYTVDIRRLWRAWTSEMAGFSIGLARYSLRSRLENDGMWDRTKESVQQLKKLRLLEKAGDADGWRFCAREGEMCEVPDGERGVMYGHRPSGGVVRRNGSGEVLCSHNSGDLGVGHFTTFPDPSPGKEKACYFHKEDSQPAAAEAIPMGSHAADWTYCTNEGSDCLLPAHDTYDVRYGISGVESFVEKKDMKGGETFACSVGDKGFPSDPAKDLPKQCFFRQTSGHSAPPHLHRFFPKENLPCLFHYCFTLESQKHENPESLWLTATPQRQWEEQHGEPLLRYMHWSKYRSFTDWPGNEHAVTILECNKPLLFHFPPLPTMLANYTSAPEDQGWQIYFALIPAMINDAVTKYRMKYCDRPAEINFHKVVRTAHDRHWFSKYECVANASNARGFSYIEAPDFGWK